MPATIFRKGLNLKDDVAGVLARDYHSQLIEKIKDSGYRWQSGRLTLYLAQEFGFCYGVDRAVDYAYQTRRRFPDQRVFLTGEIIHNPHVNMRMREAGVRFLSDPGELFDQLTPDDVVILPAFGITVRELEHLDRQGCTLVDTTCGSVLNVWKNVRKYAQDGYTAIIHGKAHHEETRATASQALRIDSGRYLVILDREEAELVCDFIRGTASREQFMQTFEAVCSPGFDPQQDLKRVGLANQTTMLMTESLEIGDMIQKAMVDRFGETPLPHHYRAFETICSATQDRQDAVTQLLKAHQFDFALVIGGYNSSNTRNLARICAQQGPAYHIAEPSCLVSTSQLRHRPVVSPSPSLPVAAKSNIEERTTRKWLAATGPVKVAVTAGASTPNNIVGEVIEKLLTFTGQP